MTWPDGEDETLRVAGDETILDAAERADLGLPFGCLTGACATCTAHLEAGEVVHERPPRALKAHHREDDYVLCCIARPRSDCRLRVGASVQRELVSNPWK
nr:2Fe-2S iron-sulfur cluster binding domain-containing protein [Halomarina oriensis]